MRLFKKKWFFNGIDVYRTFSDKQYLFVQDKMWFFNGIDVYRTLSGKQYLFVVQDKIGSSMVLMFTGQLSLAQ